MTSPFKARLPQDLKAWLEERASRTFRSTNMELVAILTEARKRDGDPGSGAKNTPTTKREAA